MKIDIHASGSHVELLLMCKLNRNKIGGGGNYLGGIHQGVVFLGEFTR